MNFNLDQINWEPIAYFFFHSSLIMAASAAVFFTLGLWFGYLTWARHKRRARAFQEECDLLRHEIASLKRRIVEETSAPAPNVAISADFSPPTVVPRSIAADAGLGGVLGLPLEDEPKSANPAPSSNAGPGPHRPHSPSPLAQLVKNATAPEPPKVSLPTINRPPVKPTEAIAENQPAPVSTPKAPTAPKPGALTPQKPQSVPPPPQEQSIATPRPTPLSKPIGAPIIVSKLSASSELPTEKKVIPPAPQAEPVKNQTPAVTPSAPIESKGEPIASAPSSQPPTALPPVAPPPLSVSTAVASTLVPAQPPPTLAPPPVPKPPLPAATVLPAIPSLEADTNAPTIAMVAPPTLPTPLPIPAFTPPIAAEPKSVPAPARGLVVPPPPKSKTAPQSLPPKPLAPPDAPTESTTLAPTTSVTAPALAPLARLAAVIAASKPVNAATTPQPSTKPPLASSEPLVADKLARLLGQAINPVAAAITPPAESGANLEAITPPDSSPPAVPIPEVSKTVAPPVAQMPGSETPTAKADAPPPALPVVPKPAPIPSTANPAAVSTFANELTSGEATIDPVLGIIFHHRPDRWDDLTLLRGVAEILQNRLYEHGVFTFKQIALWSEANIREFSTLFGFKERINREKWCQQARDLHFLKYGEKI